MYQFNTYGGEDSNPSPSGFYPNPNLTPILCQRLVLSLSR